MVFINTGIILDEVKIVFEQMDGSYDGSTGIIAFPARYTKYYPIIQKKFELYGGGIQPLNDAIQMNRSDVYYIESDPLR